MLRKLVVSNSEKSKLLRTRLGLLSSEGRAGKSKFWLGSLVSESNELRWAVNGVSSPRGWVFDLDGVRLGVVIGRKRALAADEKKSLVLGVRAGGVEFCGVLKEGARGLPLGVGVVGLDMDRWSFSLDS